MPSIYLVDVVGTQKPYSPADVLSNAVDLPPGSAYVCLMIAPNKGRAIIASPSATLPANLLVTGATWAALRNTLRTTNPNAARRNAIVTWLANGGFDPLTAAQQTWAEVLNFVSRQIEPDADCTTVEVS